MKKIKAMGLLLLFLGSCGVPQNEYDKLEQELKRVTQELDECANGEPRLVAQIEKAYSEKDYAVAREKIEILSTRHPQSAKNKEFKELLIEINKLEARQKEELLAAEKERERLANLDNTGMWRVGYYVDEFGEPTKDGYITNTSYIKGVFSNTATENSDLNVKFLISDKNDISIQLYEYARNNPVKAYSSDSYSVLMQDKDGNRTKLRATNYSDRLSFDKTESIKIHNALMKGGEVVFRITEIRTPTTQYAFSVNNAQYYDNAFRKLKEQ